jgi:hypothetical protein
MAYGSKLSEVSWNYFPQKSEVRKVLESRVESKMAAVQERANGIPIYDIYAGLEISGGNLKFLAAYKFSSEFSHFSGPIPVVVPQASLTYRPG